MSSALTVTRDETTNKGHNHTRVLSNDSYGLVHPEQGPKLHLYRLDTEVFSQHTEGYGLGASARQGHSSPTFATSQGQPFLGRMMFCHFSNTAEQPLEDGETVIRMSPAVLENLPTLTRRRPYNAVTIHGSSGNVVVVAPQIEETDLAALLSELGVHVEIVPSSSQQLLVERPTEVFPSGDTMSGVLLVPTGLTSETWPRGLHWQGSADDFSTTKKQRQSNILQGNCSELRGWIS